SQWLYRRQQCWLASTLSHGQFYQIQTGPRPENNPHFGVSGTASVSNPPIRKRGVFMPLKLNIGLCKKVGEANYGSRGASVNVEVEVDSSLVTEPAKLQERIRQLFGLVRTSLAEELNGSTGKDRQAQLPTNDPGSQQSQASSANGSGNGNGQRPRKA